jgi:hypothetical protein
MTNNWLGENSAVAISLSGGRLDSTFDTISITFDCTETMIKGAFAV